jgi:excinuclease ABC subunit C
MELQEKVAHLPLEPGVYLFKDAAETILYVGKAGVLRHRVRSYFLESALADAKTGSLVREIADVDCIVVDNEKEALALENHLIKRHKPKFNILLRDDKTYPYIRFTAFEKYPRVYVTRRLKKDGSIYFGPYFPHSLAHRIVHLIHKRFLVPSCTVDLTRPHPRPCLQYYIKRCHGPCVPGLVTGERYAEAARDVRLFLEGRRTDLVRSLEERMTKAADEERFEAAANYRDLIRTVEEIEERQKIAAAQGDDTDVLAWYAEPPQVAVNVFHLRAGRVVDRRDFYWEDLAEFEPAEFLSSLLKQLYLESDYLPRIIHVPPVPPAPALSTAEGPTPVPSVPPAPALSTAEGSAPVPSAAEHDFDDRALLEDVLSERAGRRVEIATPQRGQKRAFLDLVAKNARQSFEQRFRVLKPNSKAIVEALESALGLPEPPRRIESFDVSHIQGSDTVASMVVWENGRMKKSDYRKFIIRWDSLSNPEISNSKSISLSSRQPSDLPAASPRPVGADLQIRPPSDVAPGLGPADSALKTIDDFAAIREAVERRYRRLREEKKPLPSLILIDGGLGQLHAAAQALEKLEIINQPLASIAKPPFPSGHSSIDKSINRQSSFSDTIFVLGQEDAPIRLERHSPILHLIQQIRDETHRFAVTFHRQRRAKRTMRSALLDIPGIGPRTAQKLLRKFGSIANLRNASLEELQKVVSAKQAATILNNLASGL